MNKIVAFYCSLFFAVGLALSSLRLDGLTICVILLSVLIVVPFFFIIKKYPKGLYILFLLCAFLGAARMTCERTFFEGYSRLQNEKHDFVCTVKGISYSEPYTMLTSDVSSVDGVADDFRIKVIIRDTSYTFNYGDTLSVKGKLSPATNKNGVDYAPCNYSKGICGAVFSYDRYVTVLGNNKKPYDLVGLGYELRSKMKAAIIRCLPENEAALTIAFMFGDKSNLDDKILENNRNAGAAHAMATSGLHVSILIMCFSRLVRLFSRRIKTAAYVNIIGLALLYFLIGYSPSISRAIIMAVMMFSANLLERKSNSFANLGISAIVILWFRPFALFDVSFVLSYSAVLGIITVGSIIKKFELRLGYITEGIIFSCSAMLISSVFATCYFDSISLIGAFVSLLIVPLLNVILPLGYVTVFVGMMSVKIATPFSFAETMLIRAYEAIINTSANFKFASVSVEKPSVLTIMIVLLAVHILTVVLGKIAERSKDARRKKCLFTEDDIVKEGIEL